MVSCRPLVSVCQTLSFDAACFQTVSSMHPGDVTTAVPTMSVHSNGCSKLSPHQEESRSTCYTRSFSYLYSHIFRRALVIFAPLSYTQFDCDKLELMGCFFFFHVSSYQIRSLTQYVGAMLWSMAQLRRCHFGWWSV